MNISNSQKNLKQDKYQKKNILDYSQNKTKEIGKVKMTKQNIKVTK